MEHLAEDLTHALARLRRATRRAVRDTFAGERLSPSELELLLTVRSRPGIGVAAAAGELGMVPNTVSTLVRKLIVTGLLRRELDRVDRRMAHLYLTTAAESRLARWGEQRVDVVDAALAAFPPSDQQVLAQALPLLGRLSDAVDQLTTASSRGESALASR